MGDGEDVGDGLGVDVGVGVGPGVGVGVGVGLAVEPLKFILGFLLLVSVTLKESVVSRIARVTVPAI